jgi:hypothetical protein
LGFTNKELHAIGVTILSGISFTREFILNAMGGDPATLLHLALRGILNEWLAEQLEALKVEGVSEEELKDAAFEALYKIIGCDCVEPHPFPDGSKNHIWIDESGFLQEPVPAYPCGELHG